VKVKSTISNGIEDEVFKEAVTFNNGIKKI